MSVSKPDARGCYTHVRRMVYNDRGDCILVLEDLDGDGTMDRRIDLVTGTVDVLYEGRWVEAIIPGDGDYYCKDSSGQTHTIEFRSGKWRVKE